MKSNLILALLATIFILVLLELGLGIYAERPKILDPHERNWVSVPERIWVEYHPVLGWYNQKNKQVALTGKDWEVQVNTNASGFRGTREYAKQKPAHVTRIVALGDSFTFGWAVEDHETYSAILESEFRNLEVINMGIPGYGMDQILMSFRTIGKDFGPDDVIISVFPENFWRATRSFADSGYPKPYFKLTKDRVLELHNVPVPQPFSLKHNQFPELFEHGWAGKFFLKSHVYRLARRLLLRLAKNLELIDPDSTDEWILGRAILSELVQEVRAVNAKPLLVLIPPARWIRDGSAISLKKSILKFAQREGVDVIDLTLHFREAAKKSALTDYFLKDDWHWTRSGHRLAAKVLTEYLINHLHIHFSQNGT